MHGFMHGHTRWISEDDDDDDDEEDVDGARNNDMGPPDEEMTDYVPEEEDGLGNVDGEETVRCREDANTSPYSSLLSSAMRDPHVRDLLRKKTTSDRAASREEAKLAQLEVDSMTPLYDGCNNPEVTRLSFTLELLKMKAKNKWTDTSLDELLKYLKKVLPAGSLCPTSVEEAKKIVCPLDLPHIRYHTCINDCIIYRNEHAEKTICPKCNASRYKKAGKKAPSSCMVLSDHSASTAVFRRS